MSIGKMNRRIECINYTSTKSDSGGAVAVAGVPFTVWAQIEDRSGSYQNSQKDNKWVYDYKVTVRFRGDITSKTIFTYEGIKMHINSLTVKSEGMKNTLIAQCSKVTL